MSWAKKRARRWWLWNITIVFWPVVAHLQTWVPRNVLLGTPPGKTPAGSINIDGRQIHPSGPHLAQNKPLNALCKTLETLCDSVQVLGAITQFRWGSPNYGLTANFGGKGPKMGAPSTNCIVGHLTGAKGCQPWRPIIVCNGDGNECYTEACYGTCWPFTLAKKKREDPRRKGLSCGIW